MLLCLKIGLESKVVLAREMDDIQIKKEKVFFYLFTTRALI
jgi:hypothetical protein